MKKLSAILSLTILTALILPGCAAPEAEIPVDSAFGRMLGMVPYSILEEQDFWFNDHEETWRLHGIEKISSIEKAMNQPEEQREQFNQASRDIIGPVWRYQELKPLTGFDTFSIDRAVFVDIIPPRSFSISEGDFDKDLIAEKLTGQGYSTVKYGDYTYYTINDDYEMDMNSEISSMVLNTMNRMAVVDNLLITAPATEKMTDILDTIADTEPCVIDNTACRALAASLGDVLIATITLPDRVNSPHPEMGGIPPFDFAIPDDWGVLHQWDKAALGYRFDGEERYWIVSLYYADAGAARSDGEELVKRMKSYTLNTQFPQMENIPMTNWFEIGEATVREYSDGFTLTVISRLYPESGNINMMIGVMGTRDVLYIAPDPSIYIGKSEESDIMHVTKPSDR